MIKVSIFFFSVISTRFSYDVRPVLKNYIAHFGFRNGSHSHGAFVHLKIHHSFINISFFSNLYLDHPILQILESRIGDRQAVDFVRKQKARLAS